MLLSNRQWCKLDPESVGPIHFPPLAFSFLLLSPPLSSSFLFPLLPFPVLPSLPSFHLLLFSPNAARESGERSKLPRGPRRNPGHKRILRLF